MKEGKRYHGFIAMWIINIVLILVVNMLWPTHFVLGSYTVSKFAAVFGVSFIWNLAVWFTQPILGKLKIKINKGMSLMVIYLMANFVVLWVLARLGPAVGFGVSSTLLVLVFAFVANFVQYIVWVILAKLKLAVM